MEGTKLEWCPGMVNRFDVLVLGGGAAGLMCAIEAGKRGRRVAVIERAERLGKKILISGGGRCNFTNTDCRPQNFLSANPHFAKSALSRYTPADFIALVSKYSHRLPRENERPTILRRLGARDCCDARAGVPACEGCDLSQCGCAGGAAGRRVRGVCGRAGVSQRVAGHRDGRNVDSEDWSDVVRL